MKLSLAPGAAPSYTRPDNVCGQCPMCHPGRQFGGDSFCRVPVCKCHHEGAVA